MVDVICTGCIVLARHMDSHSSISTPQMSPWKPGAQSQTKLVLTWPEMTSVQLLALLRHGSTLQPSNSLHRVSAKDISFDQPKAFNNTNSQPCKERTVEAIRTVASEIIHFIHAGPIHTRITHIYTFVNLHLAICTWNKYIGLLWQQNTVLPTWH